MPPMPRAVIIACTDLLLSIVLQIWPSAHANFKQLLDVRQEQLCEQSALASSYFLLIVLHANSHAVSKVAIVPAPPSRFVGGIASTCIAAHACHLQVCTLCGNLLLHDSLDKAAVGLTNRSRLLALIGGNRACCLRGATLCGADG